MLAAAGAAGYSPTARIQRPWGVRLSTYERAKTARETSRLRIEGDERTAASVRPTTGTTDKALRSNAGTAFETRFVELPLSPQVASDRP